MQQVDEKKKIRKEKQENKKNNPDSTSILRNMMNAMRTKVALDEAGADERAERENDIAKISNAKEIFRQREAMEQLGEQPKPVAKPQKQKRVDVNVDFMTEGTNKAEMLRQARLKEMAAMRSARETAMEEEEMFNRKNKDKSDEIKKQREMEIDMMRIARQEALEEEERLNAIQRNDVKRAPSPGLQAARSGIVTRDFLEEKDRKVEQMRQERERELREMKRAREQELLQEEEEERRDSKSEAARELEAFRASRGGGGKIMDRYKPEEEEKEVRNGGFSQAPRSRPRPRGKSDNWMICPSQDKAEMARLAREREIEMMMVARGQAIEEEEAERAEEEMMRRAEAERKAKEMAILVADLQRMRSETARNAEEEERMTRYQEEMLSRVMELHQIAKGGMLV